MIEKKIVNQKMKEYRIKQFVTKELPRSCYSKLELKKTPLGEKIVIFTSRPGLVVGGKGANVQKLTEMLKKDFNMENPQIEVVEITNPSLDPVSIADKIVSAFERFGPKRFKSLGYGSLQEIINAGAKGAEIVISGRGVPSSRARSWRFLAGHLKKSGDIAENHLKKALSVAHLKSGSVGVKVSILTDDIRLPDDIRFNIDTEVEIQEIPVTESDEIKQVKKQEVEKIKKVTKKEEKKEEPKKKEVKKQPKKSLKKKDIKENEQEKQ